MLKKLLSIKIVSVVLVLSFVIVIFVAIVTCSSGVSIGYNNYYESSAEIRGSVTVHNNQIYAQKYRTILDKYMQTYGYVSLERLVFYLQRTNNSIFITTLSMDIWEKAYFANLDIEEKQMIPLKEMCSILENDTSLPQYTINDKNSSNYAVTSINLCVENLDLNDDYLYMPYIFPLQDKYTTTSFVFEYRDVNLDLSEEELDKVNYHSGWDFAVPIGTKFYSVCNGTVNKVVNTQFDDLSYNDSKNAIGNYVEVLCENGFIVSYHHIKANSVPYPYSVEGTTIEKGTFLGLTSSTGKSTGPHLHLGLRTKEGIKLDILEYVDFNV